MEHLITDERYAKNDERVRRRAEVNELLQERIATFSTADVLDALHREGVPAARVARLADALTNDWTVSRNMVQRFHHPRSGEIKLLGFPYKVADSPCSTLPPPVLGQHTREILSSLGYSDEAIDELAQSEVVKVQDI